MAKKSNKKDGGGCPGYQQATHGGGQNGETGKSKKKNGTTFQDGGKALAAGEVKQLAANVRRIGEQLNWITGELKKTKATADGAASALGHAGRTRPPLAAAAALGFRGNACGIGRSAEARAAVARYVQGDIPPASPTHQVVGMETELSIGAPVTSQEIYVVCPFDPQLPVVALARAPDAASGLYVLGKGYPQLDIAEVASSFLPLYRTVTVSWAGTTTVENARAGRAEAFYITDPIFASDFLTMDGDLETRNRLPHKFNTFNDMLNKSPLVHSVPVLALTGMQEQIAVTKGSWQHGGIGATSHDALAGVYAKTVGTAVCSEAVPVCYDGLVSCTFNADYTALAPNGGVRGVYLLLYYHQASGVLGSVNCGSIGLLEAEDGVTYAGGGTIDVEISKKCPADAVPHSLAFMASNTGSIGSFEATYVLRDWNPCITHRAQVVRLKNYTDSTSSWSVRSKTHISFEKEQSTAFDGQALNADFLTPPEHLAAQHALLLLSDKEKAPPQGDAFSLNALGRVAKSVISPVAKVASFARDPVGGVLDLASDL